MKKSCTKCGELKPETEFQRKTSNSDGLRTMCRECSNKSHREYTREYKKKNPDTIPKVMRKLHLKKTYGITIEEWDDMFESQKGRCAICGKHQSEFENALCVDHNHKTGKVRTLLCVGCNYFVGRIENNVELVKQIIEYVEETK